MRNNIMPLKETNEKKKPADSNNEKDEVAQRKNQVS